MCDSGTPFKPALLSHQTAWGGDAREAVTALIVATELEKLRAAVSPGYARGMLPRDRKDWYD